jgi:hypothetical protein
MARLKKELVTERETIALNAFRAGQTPAEVNKTLAMKFEGRKMGFKRLYQLREQVKNESKVDQPVETPVS